MKKTILLAAIIGFSAVSCKKDWTCSCKTFIKTTGPVPVSDIVIDNEYTILEANRATAFNTCVHTSQTEVDGNTTVVTDVNCSLK